jgi:transposase-like protein
MNLTAPIFHDETKARAHLEAIRWPNGPICPHCGEAEKVYRVTGKSARPGLIHCNGCDGQFTVTTGGVMESSKIPLTKWAMGFYLYAGSKKGFSAHQLHRQLGVTYKSAWFMAHRIREAMGPAKGDSGPMGGPGEVVEVDETEISPSRKTRVKGGRARWKNKKFVALVERDGQVRSAVIDGGAMQLRNEVRKHLHPEATLHTDMANSLRAIVENHERVDHSKEYVRQGKRSKVHTNTAEGYFSLFKRGLVGTYQHISPAHLQRYLNEFDFRMNNRSKLGVDDATRAARAIKGAEGKRLTYQRPGAA